MNCLIAVLVVIYTVGLHLYFKKRDSDDCQKFTEELKRRIKEEL